MVNVGIAHGFVVVEVWQKLLETLFGNCPVKKSVFGNWNAG
jgi:hypothetical protein